MGLITSSYGVPGVKGRKLKSTEQKAYYRLINTINQANCFFVYADSEFTEIYVKENTQVEYLHISSSMVTPANGRIQVIAGNETLEDTGSVSNPIVTTKYYRASKTINGFLAVKTNISGVASNTSCYREIIVGIKPSDILGFPLYYGSKLEKI